MKRALIPLLALALGCKSTPAPAHATADAVADTADAAGTDAAADAAADVTVTWAVTSLPPVATPTDPLAGSAVEGCAVYQAERCVGGKKQTCAVYDGAAKQFVAAPDPLVRRAFLYDRYRDLYNSPDGQVIDRNFTGAVPPGTPESAWGDPAQFASYDGGDGGIWSGWGTVAAILRYANTGTAADKARMTQYVRNLLLHFEVTGIPGYLVRYHFLLMPKGAPRTADHMQRWEDSYTPDYQDRAIAHPETVPDLPAAYLNGVTDANGKVWKGKPMWHGNPSIDQYTGPMTALPMAYMLLDDPQLKARIATQLTCYLKRLQRIEIRNLQSNPQLVAGITSYFQAGVFNPDPGDIDLTKTDTLVAYVHRQVNTKNEATLDLTCPANIQMQPWRVIDAKADDFLGPLLDLVADLGAGNQELENGIDHIYVPNLRGGDAMHLMHLAALGYWMTGEAQYKTFLTDELIGNMHALDIVDTNGSFDLPRWCKSYYGDQITYGPWWAFIENLQPGNLRTRLEQAFHHEMWLKMVSTAGNVDFDVMYAGALDPKNAPDRDKALQYALTELATFGGNGRDAQGQPLVDEPRRAYSLDPDFVLAHLPVDNTMVCPSAQDIQVCTTGPKFLGIPMPAPGIDKLPCVAGADWQCTLPDGTCTAGMAQLPVPPMLRKYSDYLWQRCPFCLGAWVGVEGGAQYAGSDFSVPYWNARRYGMLTAGKGQVLAWQDVGTCQ